MLTLVFAASLPAVTTRLYSSDEVQYFAYLRSLWFDADVSFENEYRYFYDRGIAQTPGFHESFLERQTPAGRRINFATLGCAILWAPFYAVADIGTRVARATGSDVAVDGFSQPYISAVAYGSAFYGFAAVLLGIAAARRIVGGTALLPALAVWVGTPILFYMYVAPPFSHAGSAFAVALFLTIWLRVRREWSVPGALALGLSGALVAMVREQDAFFLLGPAADFALTAVRQRRMAYAWRPALAGCAAFAIGVLPQVLAYRALNGHHGPSRLVTRKMLWHSPHALEVLFSPGHGFFVWTPLALLAVGGLVVLALWGRSFRLKPESTGRFFRLKPEATGAPLPLKPEATGTETERTRIAWCLLLMVGLQVYVSGAVDSWSVAGAFGHRRFVAVTAILVIGLTALWQLAANPAHARTAVVAVAAVCVYWNVALIALFGTRMMDRQRIEPARNAYDAFVTLPRVAPSLAWRYLFQRDSFYNPAGGGERR